jgi:histidinol-phosphate aminotransferase
MSDTYQPPVFSAPIDLDLSRNEGRPTVTEIELDSVEVAAVTSRYPDTSHLAQLVAGLHGVQPECVLVTAGGDDALFRCFLTTRGEPVAATSPSFEMIRRYATQAGSPLSEVEWWDGAFPIDDFLETLANAGMAVIVSPNNPTGSVISAADLRKVAGICPLVVLDAAYAEFADEDLTDTALELDNVVVVRTLSKAFGLAGLRVGYALASGEVVRRLAAFGSPYNVSALSLALAAGVLADGPKASRTYVERVGSERTALVALLEELGASPLPSQGNFVLATDVDPAWVIPAAASLGLGLRGFPDREELSRCVRIGLPGDEVGYDRLATTLGTVLAPEALLFDMDGVIADVRDSFRAAIVATAARFGVTITGEDIAAAKAAGDASDDWALTRVLCSRAGVDLPYETVRDEFENIYQGEGDTPGLKTKERLLVERDVLESWARRLPLGIVTARPRKDAAEFLDRFGIADYFSAVVTREDAPAKPDPAPVRLALERLGLSRAWMVGDTVDDLTAAREAGVVPIGVAVPGDDRTALTGAARVLDSVNELEEVLDGT